MSSTSSKYLDAARALLAEACEIDSVSIGDDATVETTTGWDSVSHVRLILSLQETLSRDLSTEEMISIGDLRSIAALLELTAPPSLGQCRS